MDYLTNNTDNGFAAADFASLNARISSLIGERDAAREQRDRKAYELTNLKSSLQYGLKEWAEVNLPTSDESYKDLHEVMVDNGLDGLKRTFTVTVKVTYEFEVEVEATDEDEARDEVDNNITTYAGDNVNPGWESPYESEFEVSEA